MNSTEDNIRVENKSPRKKSLLVRLFKWAFVLFALLIILIIFIFLFIQTDTFDKWALGIALDKINTSLASKDATIYAESLTGNLFKGFELNNGSIKVKGDTLLTFNSLRADYSITGLLNKNILVHDLTLTEPEINLTKIRDNRDSLTWNLDYLLSSDKIKDTTASTFDWKITAENIAIENGSVRILEEKNSNLPIREIEMPKLDTFKFGSLDVSNLNLNLSANYFPDEKNLNLKNLSFNTNSDFNVKSLYLQANVNEHDTGTSVKNFGLTTDRSEFVINELTMSDIDPFNAEDYENFGDNNTKLDLDIKKINFDDLTFFLPAINFLDSTVSLKLTAEGNYGDLKIDRLDLNTPNSFYSFEGNVKNLNHPSDLYFDVRGRDMVVNAIDTKIILPGLHIPDYSYLGKVYINNVTYVGKPDNFSSDFDFNSQAGSARGKVNFDLTQSETRYKGDISANNLNIGKIINDKSLQSDINGDFVVDARGFDYRTATGKLHYSLKRTKFYGQNIAGSDGQLNFNRGNVGLDISYFSDAVKTKLAGRINISNLKNISYDLKGTASALNIAAFTKNNSQSSNLNFDFDINGRGFNPNSMAGTYKINMSPSQFGDFNIPALPLDLEMALDGSATKISLNTDFAKIMMEGQFNFRTLAAVLQNNIDNISAGLSFGNTDSTETGDNTTLTNPVIYSPLCSNLNLTYSIDIKDLTPIYSFIGTDSIIFAGKIGGTMSDSCGLFTFTSDGIIDKFSYKDSLILTQNDTLNANIKNDITGNYPSKLKADINLSTNKLIISNYLLDTTHININFLNNQNQFSIRSGKDSTVKLYTTGILEDSLTVNFDSLALKYQDFFVTNNENLIVKYLSVDSSRAIEFRQFTVNSLDQKLSVAGKYSLTDSSDVKISSNNISLPAYEKLLNPDLDTSNMITGKVRYFNLTYRGVPELPEILVEATSDILKIGATKIGRLDANVNYKDFEITPNIVFYNERNTGNFSLQGNLPAYLNFSDNQPDSVQKAELFKGKEANLSAIATNFQLKLFQQLLPYTENLQGILKGKISLTGTVSNPQLRGNMDIDKGKVYVTLTKMNYDFYAKLASENAKLVFNDSRIFVNSDPSRFISTAGYIDLTGFTISDLNLEMSGDVKAFDKDNGQTELGISGDMWVGSGTPKLRIRGKAGRFDLTGNLILVKGNVTFNPFIQQAYNIYSDEFDYGVIIDSMDANNKETKKTLLENQDSVLLINGLNLNPFEKILYFRENPETKRVAKEKSGQFFYNVYVTTAQNVFLKFIVNEKSAQEFFGEIRTDLYIDNRDNYQMAGRGTVTLGDNCYYKFFRKFDATGKVIFTGPITNPDLNIDAVYKGSASADSRANGTQVLENVLINLKVSGSATNPTLTISLDRAGTTETGSSATSDALAFLLFGKFMDQLSFNESTSFGANIGASILSNYVSSSIEQIFPFLINTNVNYIDSKEGSVAQNTDIRFTAAFGDAIIRFGGQVFKGISNTDIAIDYPLNKLFKVESLSNNIILRLERYYDPLANSNDISSTSGKRTGALIYYKLKF